MIVVDFVVILTIMLIFVFIVLTVIPILEHD
jgi:hypothetical protein